MPWANEGYQRVDRAGASEICIGVLPENWIVKTVFSRCQPQISVGMGVIWQGVTAQEVGWGCLVSLVPRRDWPRVTDGVQLMAAVIAEVRNKQANKPRRGRKPASTDES